MNSGQRLLAVLMGTMLLGLVFYLTHARTIQSETPLPKDVPALASWIELHPSHVLAASALTEGALDAGVTDRRSLWLAAHDLALHLAPLRPQPHIAFSRSGLFHWSELSETERARVLAEIGPLLNDTTRFNALYQPIFYLTSDLGLLRRSGPNDAATIERLATLAATNGRFAELKTLRSELHSHRAAEFEAALHKMSATEIIQALPPVPFENDDEPVIRLALEELHRRPLDSDPARPSTIDALIEYALRHSLQPLDGLEAITRLRGSASEPLRARLALALGLPDRASDIELGSTVVSRREWQRYFLERAAVDLQRGHPEAAEVAMAKAGEGGDSVALRVALKRPPSPLIRPEEWQGQCGADLCERSSAEFSTTGPALLRLTLTTVQTDEVWPYIRIYLDGQLIQETAIHVNQDVVLPVKQPGIHVAEIELTNPVTRNGVRRLLHVLSGDIVPDGDGDV